MKNFNEFVTDYYSRFSDALLAFDKAPLNEVLSVMDELAKTGSTLWVAGNGGSAAIANHTICDMTKGTRCGHAAQPAIRTQSLAANVPMITALGNDVGYEYIFVRQLEYYLKPQDAVLLVSSSGNSPNVVKACEYANAQGVPTIAFVGFKGGKLKELAKHVVWVPVENYGIVEDAHQSLIHVLSQYIRGRAESTFGD